MAVVELAAGVEPTRGARRRADRACRARLAHYKCPRASTSSTRCRAHDNGKLYKRRLRDEYRARAARAGRAPRIRRCPPGARRLASSWIGPRPAAWRRGDGSWRSPSSTVSRHGYGTSIIAEVAEGAGVSTGTVYYHFPDKRSLLLALIDEWGDREIQRSRHELARMRFGREDVGLRKAIAEYLAQRSSELRHSGALRLVLLELAERDADVRARLARIDQLAIERVRDLIALGQARGVLRRRHRPPRRGLPGGARRALGGDQCVRPPLSGAAGGRARARAGGPHLPLPRREMSAGATEELDVQRDLPRNFTALLVHGLLGQTGFRLINAPTFLPHFASELAGASEQRHGDQCGAEPRAVHLAALRRVRHEAPPVREARSACCSAPRCGVPAPPASGGVARLHSRPEAGALAGLAGDGPLRARARAARGVAFPVVMAKVIPIERRGRLLGLRDMASGTVLIGVAAVGG